MNARIENEYVPLNVTPPGTTLEETLEERSMSQSELAERTGRPKKTINEIVKAQAAITPETAIQLERVLGIPASFWITRQHQYDESVARAHAEERLASYTDWLKRFPVSQMASLGWIPRTGSRVSNVESLLRFFRIASPDEWETALIAPRLGISFRESAAFKTNPYALCAWLRQGEIEASAVECTEFSRHDFEHALVKVRNLVRDLPTGFDSKLVSLCARAGVAVVFVPLIKGVHAWGATRWLNTGKAMILLSLRGKYEDVFWFSFYHEAAHLLLHGKKDLFVEEDDGKRDNAEKEADDFAKVFLIDDSLWRAFVAGKKTYSAEDVAQFASKAGVSQAITVGRLQHEGRIEPSHLNHLRRKIDFDTKKGS
jgi:addiction module HigA family antidote